MLSSYDPIARWYDSEHAHFNDDLELYQGFAAACGSPIIELGCGSGRLLVPLAVAGYAMTGVDWAATMLAHCRKRADDAGVAITLVQADMTQFALAQRDFRLLFVALGTFQHLTSLADRRAALTAMRAHARAGATLVLDLAQAEIRRCARLASDGTVAHVGTWIDDATGEVLTHTLASRQGELPGTFILTHWYDVHTPGGPLMRTCVETTMAAVTPDEITLLLEATGWHLRHRYGDHEMGEWDDASQRLVVVAQAAE